MRAQCCICADLFENSGNLNIAAVPCGHTFHEECLMRWLANSSTCPSCRKQVKKNQIIKRLFFDIPEVDEETLNDTDSLHNQISNLKAKICSFGTLKRELTDVQDKLAASVASKEEVTDKLKSAEKDRVILERQLKHVGEENSFYQKELVDFNATKKKLRKLENVQLMLEGTEEEVSEMVNCHNEGGEAAVKQLSSMVVVVKREYNKALEDKKNLRNENRDLNLQVILAQTKLGEMRKELKKYHLQLKESNKTVFTLERENNQNRRKVAHLRNALKRNKTEGSQSFIAAVEGESPNVAYTPPPPPPPPPPPQPPQQQQPQPSIKTFKTPHHSTSSKDSNVNNENDNGEETSQSASKECLSPDLFDMEDEDIDNGDGKSRKIDKMNERTVDNIPDIDPEQEKQEFYESAPSVLKMIRISSAAEKFQAAKLRKIESEKSAAPSMPVSSFSIMQKKFTGLSSSRPLSLLNSDIGLPRSRTYNGFGGSTKIEELPETPIRRASHLSQLKKKVSRKRCPFAASKPIPNQPKLATCLPKMLSTSTPMTSVSGRVDAEVGGIKNSIGNISPIRVNKKKASESKNKQNIVNNMFAKSSKATVIKSKKFSTTNSSSSSVEGTCDGDVVMCSPFGLGRPNNGVIDLT